MAARPSPPAVQGSDVPWHYRLACEIRLHYPASSHQSAVAESEPVCVFAAPVPRSDQIQSTTGTFLIVLFGFVLFFFSFFFLVLPV